jgi:hypothetical protein
VGVLDFTHVKIKSPGKVIFYKYLQLVFFLSCSGGAQAEIFRGRKKFISFNVQTVSDANLKILGIVARWPGSVDAFIPNSHTRRKSIPGVHSQSRT